MSEKRETERKTTISATLGIDLRLEKLRSDLGLSEEKLARKLDVSRGTIRNAESGNTTPSIETLISYSKYFNRSFQYLVYGKDENEDAENIDGISLYSQLSIEDKSVVNRIMKGLINN